MTVTSADQVSAKMQKVAKALQSSQPDAVKLAALALKQGILSVSPARLRNVGKNGSKLGVSYTVTGGKTPTATGRATGPWPIIEYDTPKHAIGPKKRRARGGRTAIKIGDNFRGSVEHPGTKGKLVFHKGVAIGTPKAVLAMRKTTVTAVQKGFS